MIPSTKELVILNRPSRTIRHIAGHILVLRPLTEPTPMAQLTPAVGLARAQPSSATKDGMLLREHGGFGLMGSPLATSGFHSIVSLHFILFI